LGNTTKRKHTKYGISHLGLASRITKAHERVIAIASVDRLFVFILKFLKIKVK